MESFALEKLAVELNGTPLGAKDSLFTNLQDSRTCDENSLCFVRDAKFLATLSPNAGAVITTEASVVITAPAFGLKVARNLASLTKHNEFSSQVLES